MSLWKPFRKLYLVTTNSASRSQGNRERNLRFYRLWSKGYEFSVKLDPAYLREMKKMIARVVQSGDVSLDIGCGTGLGTLCALDTAKKVIALDPSLHMLMKLKKTLASSNKNNVEIVADHFPSPQIAGKKFHSVFSSFTFVHFTKEQRQRAYQSIFECLHEGGRLGLFTAQGEVARAFETKEEICSNLSSTGFKNLSVEEVSDVYRIITAEK